jgi:NodT family efflux transporter outer membrane factor (OMF) lipoprotein
MSERSIIAGFMLFAVSCTGAQYTDRANDVVDVPANYADVEVANAPELEQWCSDFGSPELDGLVQSAFAENLDLRQAWSRLEQSAAVRKQVRASMFPAVSADASVGGMRSATVELVPDPSGMGPPTVEPSAEVGTSYRASLGAAYEVDVWGRLAAQRRAASYDHEAARADVESIAITVTSQIAEAWFDVVAQREKLALLEEQIAIATKYRELTQLRLSQGVATALDVNQQDQQIEGLRGQLELVGGLELTSRARLGVLLGKAPGSSDAPKVTQQELPELPGLPGAGAPGALLQRRPDVRSAYLRLQSADARTAAAARDKLPRLNLSASAFLQAGELKDFVDEIFWSITGAVSQSVWQGGRKDAAQQQAEAAARERLWAYARTVVQAIADVYNAHVLEGSQARFMTHLQAQHDKATIALELARERYRAGSLDYLRVLTSLQSVQQLEQSLVDARRRQLSHRVSLCRALGGSWTTDLEAPEPVSPAEP